MKRSSFPNSAEKISLTLVFLADMWKYKSLDVLMTSENAAENICSSQGKSQKGKSLPEGLRGSGACKVRFEGGDVTAAP